MKLIFLILIFQSYFYAQESNTFSENKEEEGFFSDSLSIDSLKSSLNLETKPSNTFIPFQRDEGKIIEMEFNQNKDTILRTRIYGDWWYGIFTSANGSILTGSVNWAKQPLNIAPGEYPDPTRHEIGQYTPKRVNLDFNFVPGLIVEYAPVSQDWGLAFRIFPYEPVFLEASLPLEEGGVIVDDEFYIFRSQLNYFGFSPQFTYRINWIDTKVWAGVDMFFRIGHTSEIQRQFSTNTGDVVQPTVIDNIESNPLRFGVNFGIEYEYLLQDFLNSTRIKLSPFAMVEYTTSYVSDFGSYVNPIIIRAGLSLKFGPDKIRYQTKPYDPNSGRKDILAKFEAPLNVYFEGFLVRDEIESPEIAFVEFSQVQEQVREETGLVNSPQVVENQVQSEPEVEKKKLELKAKEKKAFRFPTSEGTNLTRELRVFLDDLVTWMNDNPTAEIRVIGHSDNVGNPKEIQDRSTERARKVQSYLMAKGISRNRILITGEGARTPIADISTEQGRRQNRRVEIEVVKLK